MQKIAELDKNVSQFFDHHDPATIEQIFGSSLSQLKDNYYKFLLSIDFSKAFITFWMVNAFLFCLML